MNWKIFLGIVVATAILGALWYGVSPIFMTERVVDSAPVSSNVLSVRAPVIGTTGHPAEGTAHVFEAEGKRFVRYEDFETLNGPDLFVYLAKDLDAKEFVDLGRLRATEGSVNYEIPEGIDPSEYPYVLTWCRAFGVLFNSAKVY